MAKPPAKKPVAAGNDKSPGNDKKPPWLMKKSAKPKKKGT